MIKARELAEMLLKHPDALVRAVRDDVPEREYSGWVGMVLSPEDDTTHFVLFFSIDEE